MKHYSMKAFMKAVRTGRFNGSVLFSDGVMTAYSTDEDAIFHYSADSAEELLIAVFEALGVEAEAMEGYE